MECVPMKGSAFKGAIVMLHWQFYYNLPPAPDGHAFWLLIAFLCAVFLLVCSAVFLLLTHCLPMLAIGEVNFIGIVSKLGEMDECPWTP